MRRRTTSNSPPPPKRHRLRAKAGAVALAGCVALLGVVSENPAGLVSDTEANWTNAEFVEGTSVSTGSLAPPLNLSCEAPLVGRPTLDWEHPVDGPPERYIVEIRHNNSGGTNHHVIEDGNTHELRLSDGVLRDLLGNLLGLGGNFTARIQSAGPPGGEWTSEFSNSVGFYPGLLGIIVPRCL